MSVLVALALAHTLMSSVVVVVMMAVLVTQMVVVQCGGAIQALGGGQGTVVKVTLTAK